MAIPMTIAACWKDPSRPRYAGGATSAMYAGPMTDAIPIANPPTTRHSARSHSANGSAEPTAHAERKTTEAIVVTEKTMVAGDVVITEITAEPALVETDEAEEEHHKPRASGGSRG